MTTDRIEWTRNENSKLKQKSEPLLRTNGLSRTDLPKQEQKKNKEKKS